MIELTTEDTDRALTNFYVRSGLEGPQVLFGWVTAESPILEVQLRRKLCEYPRDLEDGLLVHEVLDGLAVAVDAGETAALLAADAAPGESAWWYYRAFVKHPPLPIELQLDGRAYQSVPSIGWDALSEELVDDIATLPVDLQASRNCTLVIQNSTFLGLVVYIETAPTEDGPWVLVQEDLLSQEEVVQYGFLDHAYKYVRVRGHGSAFQVWFLTPQEPYWAFSPLNSLPVLAYKSGRHADVIRNGNVLPEDVWRQDLKQVKAYLSQSSEGAELFNLGLSQLELGPLERFVKIFSLELDRVHAYLDALREFHTDLDNAPAQVLPHIAFELGWELDTTLPINEQRFELLRLAGFYKARGSLTLMQQITRQLLNCIPRIQEGGGLVLRFADPDLFGV